jgi:hypothetical protein
MDSPDAPTVRFQGLKKLIQEINRLEGDALVVKGRLFASSFSRIVCDEQFHDVAVHGAQLAM